MFFPKKIIIQTKFILPILIIIAFFFILIKDKPLMADENQYYPIIEKVTNLDFDKNILSKTSALPGYSFVIGFLRFSFNITDVAGTRLITTIFSLLSIIIFYLIPNNEKIVVISLVPATSVILKENLKNPITK